MSAAALVRWRDGARETSAGCVLRGPAGIGKSHLIEELLAASPGWRIMRARPAEAERRLVGSALLDLCEGVTDDELAALPPALAGALSVSLLREVGRDEIAPRTVTAAFTALIRELARSTPLLICIDDVQWLDAETEQVIAFAARRLPPAGVAVLAVLRTGPHLVEPPIVADLQAALPLTRLAVDPMPPEALRAAIRAHLGRGATNSLVGKAVDVAAGNPLFGIEVARSLLDGTGAHVPEHVPVPTSLTQLVSQHVQGLPEPTRQLLAAASAIRRPSLGELRELGVSDRLSDAERTGLIRVTGGEVSFAHPLYAAAAYDGLTGMERMALHARLAGVVTGEEERARHRALGAEQPDEAIAAALDQARDRALTRGALHAAIDACQLALRATPDGSAAKSERLIESARLLYRAGDIALAREQLTTAVEIAPAPQVKARALHALARIVADTESELPATQLSLEALELAGEDLHLKADIHTGLALAFASGWRAALEHARIAVQLTTGLADVDRRKVAAALAAYVGVAFYAGEGADIETCRRAIELEAGTVDLPVADRAVSILPYLYLWVDDFARARPHLDVAYRLCVDESDESSRGYILSLMARLELRAGNWGQAEEHIQECRELFGRTGNRYFAAVADQQQHWLDAYRGRYPGALAAAQEDIDAGRAQGNHLV